MQKFRNLTITIFASDTYITIRILQCNMVVLLAIFQLIGRPEVILAEQSDGRNSCESSQKDTMASSSSSGSGCIPPLVCLRQRKLVAR